MLAANYRQVIADSDVRCRRQQRGRRSTEIRIGRAAAEGRIRDAIIEPPTREELCVSKTVGVSLPKFANGWNPLTVPSRVDLRFVNQRGMNEPGIGKLHAVSGAQPIGRNRRQWRR